MNCRICSAEAERFAQAVILKRHPVQYFACCACGFIQTEEPFWLAEAYASPINRSDVGYVERNLGLARKTHSLVSVLFSCEGRFIDYGGGYGLFVRLMRDRGLNFRWQDNYCPNLFAQGFEAEALGQRPYELLTAFEVFEHLADPVRELGRMLTNSESIFFSTILQPTPRPQPDKWWYYGLDHGQHVSLYSLKSLSALADRFGLRLYSDGASLHLLTRRKFAPLLFRLALGRRAARLIEICCRRPSLTLADHQQVLETDV